MPTGAKAPDHRLDLLTQRLRIRAGLPDRQQRLDQRPLRVAQLPLRHRRVLPAHDEPGRKPPIDHDNRRNLGGQAALEDIAAKLTKAHEQIDTTAARIAAKDPAFPQVPDDRPALGMVVTLQPFHIANVPDHKALFPNTATTVRIASAADLEMLVVLDDESVSRLLIDLAADPERST